MNRLGSATRSINRACRWVLGARLLRGIVCAALLALSAAAGAEPLATCSLQSFVERQSDYLIAGANFLLPQGDMEDSMSFRRSLGGDWLVPKNVDATDPTIRGLLLAPNGPIRIDVLVTIAGKPYQAVREDWIDLALAPAATSPSTPSPAEQQPAEPSEDGSSEKPEESPAQQSPDAEQSKPFLGATPLKWLTDYAQNSTEPIDRLEARWLLAQRAGGPALMELERYSTKRSAAAPLVFFLDQDGDGLLSKQEVDASAERLSACDYNQDGSVEIAEMHRNRNDARSTFQVWRAEPLFVVLSDYTDWDAVANAMELYYPDADKARLHAAGAEPEGLAKEPADIKFVVRFDEEESKQPQVELQKATVGSGIRSSADAIVVEVGAVDIELNAGRPTGPSKKSQASVGAVVEGFPLWDLVDTNHDRTLSYRERSRTADLLSRLDADQDGRVSPSEMPTRVRLGVALGPNVHRLLEQPRQATPRKADSPVREAPPWFLSMDSNRDGDLTSNEFLGNAEQFDQYDADHDGLITVLEAAASGE